MFIALIIALIIGVCIGWFSGLYAFVKYYGFGDFTTKIEVNEPIPKGKTQFFEATTPQETFNKANNIGDML